MRTEQKRKESSFSDNRIAVIMSTVLVLFWMLNVNYLGIKVKKSRSLDDVIIYGVSKVPSKKHVSNYAKVGTLRKCEQIYENILLLLLLNRWQEKNPRKAR
ncbi:hypothetical protein J3Q64DRAFT_1695213 [Phycomyces blakesleeanus]|uniref:Uncharacterized protein n=2 Tax=Phycomyces blakesleeanus TaxID=4837 RepID=A0A167P088_PHYB8|nr:hypothetical protein PHYBLDRAFT_62818 [Phycomyces blakesleeanus NRRL 1555(-)]OAD76989.1 hypothetical protein PHYBLDRAFT_62818 [Phycomyces blakesleeanus NRRL 1555(-)]|eukprot:XP_018295029.1 hypothetical protein PHYBLDRAFT_62818 [Phycomyces blakesleeanus NRRL 1555(-)]